MIDLEVEVPRNLEGKWAVAKLLCPACGAEYVHVWPAELESIECECKEWFLTPLGNRRAAALERVN